MRIPSNSSLFALLCLGGAAVATAGPAGCFYPDYTFTRGDGGGSDPAGPGSTTHTSTTGTHTTTTSSSGATGGGGDGGTGGQPGTGGSQGGGGSGSEDCLNGVDDDADDAIDCADPKCFQYKCVNPVPTGWSGLYALFEGPPSMDPGCPALFPDDVYSGNADFTANPAQCKCTCGEPQNEKCVLPDEIRITSTACSDTGSYCYAPLANPTAWTGTCTDPSFTDSMGTYCGVGDSQTCTATGECTGGTQNCQVSARTVPPTVSGGSCAPGAVNTVKTHSWGLVGHLCGSAAGAGCTGSQVCAPKPTGQFKSGLCVMQTGDVDCPAGVFTDKHTYFGGFDESRACTGTCACGDPDGSTCEAMITLYADHTACPNGICTGTALTTFKAGGCGMLAVPGSDVGSRKASITMAPDGGSCAPDNSGTTASGTASPNAPTTVCCIP